MVSRTSQRWVKKQSVVRLLAACCVVSGTAQAEFRSGPPTQAPSDDGLSIGKIDRVGVGNGKSVVPTRMPVNQKMPQWRIGRMEQRTLEDYSRRRIIVAQSSWRPPPTSQMVSEAQWLLGRLGFDAGPADGAMGFRTRQAIRRYQSQAGLPVNGQVSDSLLVHLRRSHAQGRVVRHETRPPSNQASQSGQTKQQTGVRSRNTQQMVDDLRKIIRWAHSRHLADPELLDRLRALAKRYDLVWPVRVFHDEFADGNYTWNPPWTALGGDIRITRNNALRLSLKHYNKPAAPARRQGDPGADILGSILQQVLKEQRGPQQQRQAPAGPATVYSAAKITNAFSAEFRIRAFKRGGPGHFEIGIYRGNDHRTGYRLDFRGGQQNGIELRRESVGRSSVIDYSASVPRLDDGKWHTVQWQRKKNGQMTVRIDGKRVMRTIDRAYRQGFGGVTLVNHKGEHAVGRVSIYGTKG